MNRMGELSSIDIRVVAVSANIHMLFRKIKEYGFYVDIIKLLLELDGVSEEDKTVLQTEGPYAYKYLVFDMDLQDYDLKDEYGLRQSLKEIEDMLDYFDDETDDSKGKLYINYPMVESYRDCHSPFEKEYAEKVILVEQSSEYKTIVGNRGNSRNLGNYTRDDFRDLICMNLYKLSYIFYHRWEKPRYEQYVNTMNQFALFKKEQESVLKERFINVINSLMFFPVDYLGDAHGYYRNLRPR